MKEKETSDNDEVKSFLINEINKEKEKDKKKDKGNEEEEHIKQENKIQSNQKIKNEENNQIKGNSNNIYTYDDSNSFLKNNNNINQSPNLSYGLRLYLSPNKCCQLLKMTKMGKSFAFLYNKNDDPMCIIGPQWAYCIFLSIIATLAYIFIYIYYNDKSTTLIKISDWFFFGIWFLSYIFICIKNPGYPKNCSESIKGTKEMSYCDKCEIWYKPSSSTIHCEICDICIEGYTHHCSWTGHCIGGNNKKFFYLFLIISILFPIYLMINIVFFGKH